MSNEYQEIEYDMSLAHIGNDVLYDANIIPLQFLDKNYFAIQMHYLVDGLGRETDGCYLVRFSYGSN